MTTRGMTAETSGRPSFASWREAARICADDLADGNVGHRS